MLFNTQDILETNSMITEHNLMYAPSPWASACVTAVIPILR